VKRTGYGLDVEIYNCNRVEEGDLGTVTDIGTGSVTVHWDRQREGSMSSYGYGYGYDKDGGSPFLDYATQADEEKARLALPLWANQIVDMLKAQTASITALQEEVKALRAERETNEENAKRLRKQYFEQELKPQPRICDTCKHRTESSLSYPCAPCFITDTKPNREPE